MSKSSRFLVLLVFGFIAMSLMSGCSPAQVMYDIRHPFTRKNSVQPIRHHGYYKNHIYRKRLHVGNYRFNWLDQQGTFPTRHRYRSSKR